MAAATKQAGFFESPFVKLAIMTMLILVLLIPLTSIQSLIAERKARQANFEWQLDSEWGGRTTYSGLAIRVPYAGKSGKEVYIYPVKAHDDFATNVMKKHRGIYTSQIYNTSVRTQARFDWEQIRKTHEKDLNWNAAQVCLVIDKQSRVTRLDSFDLNGQSVEIAGSDEDGATRIFYAPLPAVNAQYLNVRSVIAVNGNSEISVGSLATEHTMSMHANWADPAFEGNSLPAHTKLNDKKGFVSQWQSLDIATGKNSLHSRPSASTVAKVRFIEPLDFYQLNERTIKYGILVLSLTFAVFFLIELTKKMSINPIHYVLIGLGLMLFYLLLLSFSEQIGFIGAYIVAGTAIIALIGWYARSVLQSAKFASLVSVSLVLLYTFLIVIVHLEVYALIAGSIGLLVVLFLIMSVTRKLTYTSTT